MPDLIEYPADNFTQDQVPPVETIRAARDRKDAVELAGCLEKVSKFYNFVFDCLMVAKGNGIQTTKGLNETHSEN